jgi:DNA-binding response OmpR family regulator
MKKILIVDDDPDIIELTKKGLEASGYKVTAACDGVEGLKKAIEEKPDLILLDIIMPKKDGFAMLKDLKENKATSDIPVIMLSAKGETDALLKSEKFGVVDYFIKPCDWDELLNYIKRYV